MPRTLASRVTALIVLALVFLAGLLLAVATTFLEADADKRGAAVRDQGIRIAHTVLSGYGDTYSVRQGTLYVGNTSLRNFNEPVDRIRSLTGGVATLILGDVRLSTNVMAKGVRAVGTHLSNGAARDAVLAGRPYRGEAEIVGKTHLVAYDPIRDAQGKVIGSLFSGVDKGQFYEPVRNVQRAIAAIGLAAAMIIGAAIFVATRRMFRPLEDLRLAMERLSEGDTRTEIPGLSRRDDIGDMARTVATFKDAAQSKERLEAEAKDQALAAERSKRQVASDLADRFEAGVSEVVNRVAERAVELERTSVALSATANATSDRSITVAAAADEATANVAQVAASAEQVGQSVAEIARQVGYAAAITDKAVKHAQFTRDTIERLSDSSQRIGEVVTLIASIASQTNLLALNATIESARAGAAGQGFAVVASEVKNLATQTARATDEISGQVTTVQAITQDSVAAITEIQSIIAEMNSVSTTISAAVEQQSAATREIARNTHEAASGAQDVSRNINGVLDGARETDTASKSMVKSSRDLGAEAALLSADVRAFLISVRAA